MAEPAPTLNDSVGAGSAMSACLSRVPLFGRVAQTPRPMPFPQSTASIAATCCLLAAGDIEERAGDERSLGACQP